MTDLAKALAPYLVMSFCIAALLLGKLDPAAAQLLSTIVGVCGGAILPRRAEGSTTTVTAGDPPQITTKPND